MDDEDDERFDALWKEWCEHYNPQSGFVEDVYDRIDHYTEGLRQTDNEYWGMFSPDSSEQFVRYMNLAYARWLAGHTPIQKWPPGMFNVAVS